MFRFDEELKVYLHREPVDFRLNINGLAVLVEQALGLDPFALCAYVFSNRRHDRVSTSTSCVVPPKCRKALSRPCSHADWRSCRNMATKVRWEYPKVATNRCTFSGSSATRTRTVPKSICSCRPGGVS